MIKIPTNRTAVKQTILPLGQSLSHRCLLPLCNERWTRHAEMERKVGSSLTSTSGLEAPSWDVTLVSMSKTKGSVICIERLSLPELGIQLASTLTVLLETNDLKEAGGACVMTVTQATHLWIGRMAFGESNPYHLLPSSQPPPPT
jgi:hypothetical protein